ncbi:MAG: hypothetical protein ACKVHP_04720, partial [Verrucomicrobiales bacterium]
VITVSATMTKYSLSIMSGLAIASLSFAIAEEAAEKCEKACKVAVASDCAECPLTAAMEALPKISYVIAGEASACAKSAEAAAEAGKEVKAHLGAVETFVASFASTHAYDASGKTFVGNKGFECGEHAKTIAAVAKTAMAEVKTVHFVGTQEFCCPTAAGEAAEKEGAKVTYVVNEEKTQCAKTNRMNVAVAKYKAAVLAIAKAEAPEKSAS